MIKIDRSRDRIYMKAGGGYFLAYRLSTFASQFSGALATGAHGEKYRQPLFKVNPETPGSGWQTKAMDGQDRLSDFDFDDRGYLYLAYSIWGFGIVDSTGHLVKQVPLSNTDPSALSLFTFPSEGHEYLVVSDSQSSVLWDVTDPTSPQKVTTLGLVVTKYAKTAENDAIAIYTNGITPTLKIYTPAQLISAGSPIDIQPHGSGFNFTFVTSGGADFYASERSSTTMIVSTISRSSDGFAKTEKITTANVPYSTSSLDYGSGYLSVTGLDGSFRSMMLLYRWNGSAFVENDPRSYVQSYFPISAYITLRQVVPYCTDAGFYAITAAKGLGDVFGLVPAVASCLPGAPQSVSATADDASANVSFSPPASDGGSPITSYTVTSAPGGITATGTAPPITIAGLTNGTTYTFTVTARNAVGPGPASSPSNAATPASTLIPPAIMSATSSGTTQVNVTWSAASKAQHYEVLRSVNGSAYEVIASPAALSYPDTNVLPDTTYLYKIRSIDSSSSTSDTTPIDPATTIDFTDDPLTAGVTIAAAHFAKVRTAVNAMRAAAGLSALAFADGDLSGLPIAAAHMTQLRSGLDEARSQIGLPALSYTDPDIVPGVTFVRASHLQQIRDAVK